jgi:hypothetical protein
LRTRHDYFGGQPASLRVGRAHLIRFVGGLARDRVSCALRLARDRIPIPFGLSGNEIAGALRAGILRPACRLREDGKRREQAGGDDGKFDRVHAIAPVWIGVFDEEAFGFRNVATNMCSVMLKVEVAKAIQKRKACEEMCPAPDCSLLFSVA